MNPNSTSKNHRLNIKSLFTRHCLWHCCRCSLNCLLTARPWVERGSYSTPSLFLTAWPWTERGSFFVFLVSSATRSRSPLGQLWITQSVVLTPESLLEHKYMRTMLRVWWFFLWNIFFLEGHNKYAKMVLRRLGMRWCCSFHFRYVTNKIVLALRVNLTRSDRHDFICNFASISCGLRQMKWTICLFHRIAASSVIGKKIKYLKAKRMQGSWSWIESWIDLLLRVSLVG